VKLTRKDFLSELEQPEKSGPLHLFCSSWWLVVPAPWKDVLLCLGELPVGWGLLEVGTGEPRVVVGRPERADAEEPTPGFLKALLRSASTAAAEHQSHQGGGGDVPRFRHERRRPLRRL
jgi:hypothetical protein